MQANWVIDSAELAMNKFSRLFEDRQLAAHPQAKATAEETNPLAKAIAMAAAIAPAKPPTADSASDSPPPTTDSAAASDRPAPSRSIKLTPKRRTKKKTKGKSKTQAKTPPTDPPRKRGRPANGKRSDPEWYGRTFYIRKQTDVRLEDALNKLRRSGLEFDKSQLVDALLNAWASIELEQIADFQIGEILEKPEA
jgi:hypothetical protein